jgi:hypothetical protein
MEMAFGSVIATAYSVAQQMMGTTAGFIPKFFVFQRRCRFTLGQRVWFV